MSKKIVIANWKMNPPTLKEAEALFLSIAKAFKNTKNSEVVICSPFVFLADLKKKNKKKLSLGAQNVFFEKKGPYTGEVSGGMLKSFGVKYVIVGHSDRRAIGETNEIIAKKVLAVLKIGITPILCIGETHRDHSGSYLAFIKKQLTESINGIPKTMLSKIIITYEPVWAISTSKTREITSEDSKEMAIFIKKTISDISDAKTAHSIRVIYGGSVNPKNYQELLSNGGVDGVLVGAASLSVKDFSQIIN
jgi:triosephosphate isomerase